MNHCRHFEIQGAADDEDPTATIYCEADGWWAGPVKREGAWKSRLIELYRNHIDRANADRPVGVALEHSVEDPFTGQITVPIRLIL